MEVIRGNKTLSGTWGELWINGEKIFEFSKIEMKVTANREDVQQDYRSEGRRFLYREKGIYQSKGNLGELEKGHGCPCRGYCEAGRS